MLEEKLRRLVKQRPTRDLGPTGNLNQPSLHQRLQHAFDCYSPNRFHIGPSNRLAVGDDGEGLERRWRETSRFRGGEKLPDPPGILRIARQLPAFGFFK